MFKIPQCSIDFFDRSFFQSLLVVLLGLVVGIPVGLQSNALLEKRQDIDNKNDLLIAYRTVFKRTIKEVNDTKESLYSYVIIERSIDLSVIENTAALRYELLDIKTCQQIDATYHHLKNLERKIRHLSNILVSTKENHYKSPLLRSFVIPKEIYNEIIRQDPSATEFKKHYGLGYLRGSILGHSGVVLDSINETLSVIEQQIISDI